MLDSTPAAIAGVIRMAICRLQKQGDSEAQLLLGSCYDFGHCVARDYSEAVKWYRQAAEQGNAGAQFNLGCSYRDGTGVPQDYMEAVKWFRKGAEQGDGDAQGALGACYAF